MNSRNRQTPVSATPDLKSGKNGSQAIPVISGWALFGRMPAFRRQPLETFSDLYKQFGDVICFRGLWTSFMLTDPHAVEHVLQTNSRNYWKGRTFQVVKSSLGNGLFVSEGDFWLRQRRLMQPVFHKQKIASFAKIITDSTESMLEQWQTFYEREQSVEVASEMLQLTLGIVGKALFSRDLSGAANTFGQSFEIVRDHLMRRIISIVRLPESLPTPRNRRFRAALGTAEEVIFDLIAERRQGKSQTEDLLSMLLEARDEETGETMNDQQLRDECVTIIGAGYETTTQALAQTWYLVPQHPEVEKKLVSEIETALNGRTPTYDDLPRLKCTLQVFQEAMRLYPPAWMMPRAAIEADEIDGLHIPAKSEILLFTYLTHRHPEIWENPEIFDPERFSPENSQNRHKFAYFPFGGGPRQCIGKNLALMEAQLIIPMVLQKYRLSLVPNHPVEAEPSLTLRPRYGLKMILQRR